MKTLPVGVVNELIQGDVFFWGSLMAGVLLGSVPVALIYSFFVEYYMWPGSGRRREGVANELRVMSCELRVDLFSQLATRNSQLGRSASSILGIGLVVGALSGHRDRRRPADRAALIYVPPWLGFDPIEIRTASAVAVVQVTAASLSRTPRAPSPRLPCSWGWPCR